MEETKRCMGCMETYDARLDVCPHCGYVDGQDSGYVLHLKPGTLLHDRYEVGRCMGYGSFGVTYLGWDRLLGHKVAIKEYLPSEYTTRMSDAPDVMMPPEETARDRFERGLKRFRREAESLAALGHVDGVVYIHDTFEENNTAYIVMEYLQGETLASYLERSGPLSEEYTMELMLPLLNSLSLVHEAGLIHRDISPENIFLSVDSLGKVVVKLIDFGAAKFSSSSASRSLTVLLRPGYSPEEQYRSAGEQGPHTDVYAVAAVMYQMVTGVKPPDALERRTAMERKKRDLLKPPTDYNPDLSDNFETALLNALNVQVEDRTATADEFVAELISYEPVARRGSKIRTIDFLRWPLWARIGVPVAAVAAIVTIVAIVLWVGGFTGEASGYSVLEDGYVYVIDFLAMTQEQAEAAATEAQLAVSVGGSQYSPRLPADTIIQQNQAAGTVVPLNFQVPVILSTNNEEYTMPKVLGMSQNDAMAALGCMELDVKVETGSLDGVAEGCVISQSTEPFATVKTGDAITITVAAEGTSKAKKAPELKDKTYEAALTAAAKDSAVVRVTEWVFTDAVPDGTILTQTGGTSGPVEVTAACAPRDFPMPNLKYKDQETAQQLAKNLGLVLDLREESNEIITAGLVADQSVDKDASVRPGQTVTLTVSSGGKPFPMPDVTGKTEAEARTILSENGLVMERELGYDESVKEGSVISQSVSAGSNITRGSTVTIVVCSKDATVEVPDVTDFTEEYAKKALEDAGFKVETSTAPDNNIAAGNVVSQQPRAGTKQAPGSTVYLTVSTGAEDIILSDYTGYTSAVATGYLQALGLNVVTAPGSDATKAADIVLSQDPAAGSTVHPGDTVTLTVNGQTATSAAPAASATPTPYNNNNNDNNNYNTPTPATQAPSTPQPATPAPATPAPATPAPVTPPPSTPEPAPPPAPEEPAEIYIPEPEAPYDPGDYSSPD